MKQAISPLCVLVFLCLIPAVEAKTSTSNSSSAPSSQNGANSEATVEQNCANIPTAPAVVISAVQPRMPYYCKTIGSAQAKGNRALLPDLPIQLPNSSSLRIIVKDINPLTKSFAVSFNGAKYAEIDGTILAGIVGSVPTTGQVPNINLASTPPSKPQPGGNGELYTFNLQDHRETSHPPNKPGCTQQLQKLENNIKTTINIANNLTGEVNDYRNGVEHERENYSAALDDLIGVTTGSSGDGSLQSQFKRILQRKDINPDSTWNLSTVPPANAQNSHGASLQNLGQSPTLSDVVDSLHQRAIEESGALDALSSNNCGSDLIKIQADRASLDSIYKTTSSQKSLVDNLKSEIAATESLASKLAEEESKLQRIANDPSNFEIEVAVPPEDRKQTAVAVTISWTHKNYAGSGPSPSASAAANGAAQGAGNGSGTGQGGSKDQPAAPTNAQNSTTFTIDFGQGPRSFQSAGVVFSPLAQHSFATAAVGSSKFCTATGNETAVGCIVDDSQSGWRILPVVLGSIRFVDTPKLSSQWRPFIPNYLTIGATIKSNSSGGTNLEYLLGPSFASAGQRIFVTAGAYAGEVNRLAGGLTTGPQTVAPPGTLPTSSGYRWKFGFAISYSFASQGGSSKPSISPSSPSSNKKSTSQ